MTSPKKPHNSEVEVQKYLSMSGRIGPLAF
jgi:hypothetical protein